MPRPRALLLLFSAACAPPPGESEVAEPGAPVTTRVAPPPGACPLDRWEHVSGIIVGAAPATIAVKTWHGNCGPGGVLISRDDGRTFSNAYGADDVLGVADDGTAFLIDRPCGPVRLLHADGSDETIEPPAPDECIWAVAARGPWLAIATPGGVWRTRDRQELWQWRLADGASLGVGAELELDENGGVYVLYQPEVNEPRAHQVRAHGRPDGHELAVLPWHEEADPDQLWAQPSSDWYTYRDRAGALWAANGPLALPLALPSDPDPDFLFGGTHVCAVAGDQLFALEHGMPVPLAAKVPADLRAWTVDAAGRVLAAARHTAARWSPETGWQTLFACAPTDD